MKVLSAFVLAVLVLAVMYLLTLAILAFNYPKKNNFLLFLSLKL